MRDVSKETPERENISMFSHRGILQPLHMAKSLIAARNPHSETRKPPGRPSLSDWHQPASHRKTPDREQRKNTEQITYARSSGRNSSLISS